MRGECGTDFRGVCESVDPGPLMKSGVPAGLFCPRAAVIEIRVSIAAALSKFNICILTSVAPRSSAAVSREGSRSRFQTPLRYDEHAMIFGKINAKLFSGRLTVTLQ